MAYATPAREKYEHERAADEWATAKNRLKEAEDLLASAQMSREQAVNDERAAWESLQVAAGRAPAPPTPTKLASR
jgi:hypothetical protein